MFHTAQFDTVSRVVFAINDSDITGQAPPNGVGFKKFDPAQVEPLGMYVVNNQFQKEAP